MQQELCGEAQRLTLLLIELPAAAVPETFALAALMHLQAARLPTRLDAAGDLSPLLEQDRSRWDAQLVQRGLQLLDRSATGDAISAYHVEAAIAAAHATARSVAETNWDAIVGLYDRLMTIAPTTRPMAGSTIPARTRNRWIVCHCVSADSELSNTKSSG